MANLDSFLEMGLEPAQDRLAFPCKTHHRVARDGEADAVVRGLGVTLVLRRLSYMGYLLMNLFPGRERQSSRKSAM